MDAEHDAGPPTVGMATETVERGHEERDVRVRTIFVLAAGFLVVAGAIQVVLYFHLEGLWALRRRHLPPPSPVASALPPEPPEPRLQTAPAEDLHALRAAEQAQLGTYGWVDRDAGVVRIPIDRAIELVAREADRGSGRAGRRGPGAAEQRSERSERAADGPPGSIGDRGSGRAGRNR